MSEQAAASASPDRIGHPLSNDFRLGSALIQPTLNRVSVDERTVQLEPKVMQVLTVLAARPGAVVPRQDFLDTVWADTVGDDYLLNRAVSELRKALDDDPQKPAYIETIRKTGYRLIAPIAPARVASLVRPTLPATPAASAVIGTSASAATVEPVAVTKPDGGIASAAVVPARAGPAPTRSRRLAVSLAIAAFGLLVVAVLAYLLYGERSPAGSPLAERYDVRPLTSQLGREIDPALSPDGSRVAYVRDGGQNGRFALNVQTIGTESVLALTDGEVDDRYPVWMPDGRHLLFVRADANGGSSILRIPALGGTPTRAHNDPDAMEIRGLSLAPDGETLVYARRSRTSDSFHLVATKLDDGATRVLTTPPPGSLGDIDPRYAWDGQALVFIRGINEVTKDLYRLRWQDGELTRLSFDNRKIAGLAWAPDGQHLLYGSSRSGMYQVWALDGREGGTGVPLLADLGGETVQQLATAPGVDAIVFEEWTHRAHMRRIELDHGAAVIGSEQLSSTRWDSNPDFAPDGSRVAFTSNRGGPPGIWIGALDGRSAMEIASLGGAFIERPAWSPDGRTIAFDGSPDGRTSIFLVAADGGPLRPFTTTDIDARSPTWSRDGSRLYYEANVDGAWRIQAQATAGGAAIEIAPAPAQRPRESLDGAWLYFARPDRPGLWRKATTDLQGSEQLIVPDLDPRDWENWALAANGVYYLRRPEGAAPVLSFLDHSDGEVRDLLQFSSGFDGWGLTLSPDGRTLLYSEIDIRESDLRIALPRR